MLLSQIINKDINLKHLGSGRYEGLCPWHDDNHASLKIHDGKDFFKCFVCGKGGKGVVQYIMLSRKLNYKQSLQLLNTEYDEIDFGQEIASEEDVVYCLPLDRFKKPSFHHYIHGNPTNIYDYRSLTGRLLGYTCRYITADGGKVVLPYNYIMVGDSPEWVFKGFRAPSLPYKAEMILSNPHLTICIVEGEKVVDYALANSNGMLFLAWVGGANGVNNVDWSCLKDRNVILIPDHDKEAKDDKGNLLPIHLRPGNKAMLDVALLIQRVAKKIEFVKIPEEYPHKWDVADREDWKQGDMKFWINKHKQDYFKLKL